MIYEAVKKLICYGVERKLVDPADVVYTTNGLLEALGLSEYEEPAEWYSNVELSSVLEKLCDYAVEQGLIQEGTASRDLFDTKLMGILTPPPSAVRSAFWLRFGHSPREATDFYYQFSQDTDYIRRYRIAKVVVVGGFGFWDAGYFHQPVQAREGSQGDCSSKAGEAERLSQMSALHGK